jgi:hypothetical protein
MKDAHLSSWPQTLLSECGIFSYSPLAGGSFFFVPADVDHQVIWLARAAAFSRGRPDLCKKVANPEIVQVYR